MELRFSSTTSRDRPRSILLILPDGVDHVLLRGEHLLLLLLVAKVLRQVESPPVASLAPTSTVPAWHLLALLSSCLLQIISEGSDAETLCRWVYINDPARSSGMQHTLITEYIAFRGIHTRGLFQMKMSVKCQYQVGKHLFCVFQTKSDDLSGHTEQKYLRDQSK